MLGNIEISGKDAILAPMPFDRIATYQHELKLVSLVAPTQQVKAVRALLNGQGYVTARVGGLDAAEPSFSCSHVNAGTKGYSFYAHRISYGLCHAIAVTRSPGFLPVADAETLWQELSSARYTTPLLRAWVPYLAQQLRLSGRLADCQTYRCQCGVLAVTSQDLDDVVSQGVRSGSLRIAQEAACD
jgi:hypothetical protein